MKETNAAVGVDFQNDFVLANGNLPVPGGEDDATRFGKFIENNGAKIDELSLTHDCHDLHIATPIMWVDSDGNHPAPFTNITYDMAVDRVWRINSPLKEHQDRGIKYLKELQDEGRYILSIWNPHCQIGTIGAAIYEPLINTAIAWRNKYTANITHVTKGSNPWTEHYSAMKAAVVDPMDRSTALNKPFIEMIQEYDNIYFAGEALNFCVRETMLDIIRNFEPENVKKIVLITDCTSPIPDAPGETLFQSFTDSFMDEAITAGMRTALSTDII